MNNIDKLNDKLIASAGDKWPIGLADGKMGLCLYFYYLSRWKGKEEYKQIAEKLLDDIVNNLSDTMDITVESGLAGMSIGISHLIKEKFIEGDINDILEDVDSIIFKKLAFLVYKDAKKRILKAELIHLLYYLHLRYTEQSSVEDKYFFQELMIKTIEMFKEDLQDEFFSEPFSFSLRDFHLPFFLHTISKIYELNIYRGRIAKIMEEYINRIVSLYPVSQANRLYFLWGLISIKPCFPDYEKEIDSHIRLLREGVDIDYIVNTELRNQDVYIARGLSSVYLLLFYLQMKHPTYSIDYNPQLFFTRIRNSEVWSALLDRELYFHRHDGLFDGFPGVYLTLLHIEKNFL